MKNLCFVNCIVVSKIENNTKRNSHGDGAHPFFFFFICTKDHTCLQHRTPECNAVLNPHHKFLLLLQKDCQKDCQKENILLGTSLLYSIYHNFMYLFFFFFFKLKNKNYQIKNDFN